MNKVVIIGGGLAGSECAWALAEAGVEVTLYEMKPVKYSEAHTDERLGELICSNSLRSSEPSTAIGILKEEMTTLGSLVMEAANATKVPAGKALAVDRDKFAQYITDKITAHDKIALVREEVESLKSDKLDGADAIVVAAGPLASSSLVESLLELIGDTRLYFYDAIAPIISTDSVDTNKAFWGSRYNPEDHSYLNCPMTEEEYDTFLDALLEAEKVVPREFEKEIHFEGCLPVEAMAERGRQTLTFGPLKPVGLELPDGGQAYAVVQLRAENEEKTSMNMVGFQTKLKYPEQKRVFSMIPGLENAEFLRLGSIHRNTYVNAPLVLNNDLSLKTRKDVFLAGQITGVEGYLESAACGLWLGYCLTRKFQGMETPDLPQETALGGLMNHLREEKKNFQPSNSHFGLTPPLNKRAPKKVRKELYGKRAQELFAQWLESVNDESDE